MKKAFHYILVCSRPVLLALLSTLVLTPLGGAAASRETDLHGAGVIDRSGRTIIPCKYRMVRNSNCGYWLLTKFDPLNPDGFSGEEVVVDNDGKLLNYRLPKGAKLEDLAEPDNVKATARELEKRGVMIVKDEHQRLALADFNGHYLLWERFDSISQEGEDMFVAKNGKQTVLFDASQKRVVRSFYKTDINHFENGSAVFTVLGDERFTGLVNRDGSVVFQGNFSEVSNIHNGLAVAGLVRPGHAVGQNPSDTDSHMMTPSDPSMVYVDKHGKSQSPLFDYLEPFYEEVAVARLADRFGLIDRSFKFVTTKKYASLHRVQPNVFVARAPHMTKLEAIDSKGHVLFEFPSTVDRVAASRPGVIVCRLKPIDPDPNFDYGPIAYQAFNLSGKKLWEAKNIDTTSTDDSSGLWGASDGTGGWVIDATGRKILPRQSYRFQPITSDRILKEYMNYKFSPEDWKRQVGPDLFGKLLRQYDLIGMPRAQVVSLIGPKTSFWLNHALCGNAARGVEFEFENKRLRGWRFMGFMDRPQESDWIKENVIWDGVNYSKEFVRPKYRKHEQGKT
jgi:hypothetical protein